MSSHIHSYSKMLLGVVMLLLNLGVTGCNNVATHNVGTNKPVPEVVEATPNPWALPTPPPKSAYDGPLFQLSHAYPSQEAPPNPAPWREAIGNGQITTQNAGAYVQALKDYIAKDMQVLLFDYQNWDAGASGWYNQPWLASVREPIHGTYVGSSGMPPAMFPKSGLKTSMATHVLVYYDRVAATSLSKVWGTSGMDPVPGMKKGGAQFAEGSIIVKPAFTTASGNEWPPIAGAHPWNVWIAPNDGTSSNPELQSIYLFQFDIIVKDSQSAPKTGWVFSTLVYAATTPGTAWDKMIPLGAMWGNDPDVNSPEDCNYLVPGSCPELFENWINQSTPVFARETLGWGGRLSGPNDGAVDINARIKTSTGSVPYSGRYAASSCMGCHGSAEYEIVSFLLPVPANCANDGCQPTTQDGSLVYYPAGSPDFKRWFQDRPGDQPMDPNTIALDYGMNYSFKVLPAWFAATGQKGQLNFVTGFNEYRGRPHQGK